MATTVPRTGAYRQTTCDTSRPNRDPLSVRRRKRPRRRELFESPHVKALSRLVLVGIALYCYVLACAHGFVDQLFQDTFSRTTAANNRNVVRAGTIRHLTVIPGNTSPGGKKYLLFRDFGGGQGHGNVISGLLAAHLLGLEFNRTVCVDPLYSDFLAAFTPIHPAAVADCPSIVQALPKQERDNTVELINFSRPANECAVKKKLESNVKILYFVGNTYPRWPAVPDQFFFSYYAAKPELLDMLSYPIESPPHTVVHLRQSDSLSVDPRPGLDETSLLALGRELPSDTYLVTNRPSFYRRFEEEFGWSHPNWKEVVHSALQKSWGTAEDHYETLHKVQTPVDPTQQNLQLQADWYTLLTAKRIVHTHSDFSLSAIHWNNIDSATMEGTNATTGQLLLAPEDWRLQGETPRLVDRLVEGPDKGDLHNCKRERQPVRHDDDAFHYGPNGLKVPW